MFGVTCLQGIPRTAIYGNLLREREALHAYVVANVYHLTSPAASAEQVEGLAAVQDEEGGVRSGSQVRSFVRSLVRPSETTTIGEVGRHGYHGGVSTEEFGGSMPQ